jgi:hypothetical protein
MDAAAADDDDGCEWVCQELVICLAGILGLYLCNGMRWEGCNIHW